MGIAAVNVTTDINFNDPLDALGKVVGGFKTLANIPRIQGEKYWQTMNDTYRLFDTVLNMIILRLVDTLAKDDEELIKDAQQLDNFGDWLRLERDLRLCHDLRAAADEMESLRARLVGKISVTD